MKKKKWVKKYKFEYFFGERFIVYVRFPGTMTVNDIVNELFWAKTWKVDSMASEVIVRAIVKPMELSRFNKQNISRIMKFSVDEEWGKFIEVKEDEQNTTVYDL